MEEKIWFKNSKGDKLCGILSDPIGKKDKIVILCHGFSTGKDGETYLTMQRLLNEKNLTTFRFDFFGHGESQGKFEDVTVSEAVDDVLQAINFVKSLGYKKIGLLGSSFGGMAIILAASKTPDLSVLVLISPVSIYRGRGVSWLTKDGIEKWKRKGWTYYYSKKEDKNFKLNYTFYEDAISHDGYKAAEKINAHTLILHGDKDEYVPVENSKKLAKLIKSCKLKVIKGAYHHFTNQRIINKRNKLATDFIVNKLV